MNRGSDDERKRLGETLGEVVRSSSRPMTPAVRPDDDPRSRPKTVADEAMLRIEGRQEKVVELLAQTIETNCKVIDEINASMDEDERVREELAATRHEMHMAREGYRKMRRAVYVSCVPVPVVLVTFAAVVATSLQNAEQRAYDLADDGFARLNRFEVQNDALAESMTSLGDALSRKVEADVALHPEADERAMAAAYEAQEKTAKAEITIAKSKGRPAPKKAVEQIDRARRKKKALKGAGPPDRF